MSVLFAGYLVWHSHAQGHYRWLRGGNTYKNTFYGLQITKKDEWLRYKEGNPIGKQVFISRLFGNPALFLFPKKNLIEFHRLEKSENPDAIFFIGPIDDLKDKSYGHSLNSYAHAYLESVIAPKKMWVKKGQIAPTEINGVPCAKANVSYEIQKIGELEGEIYFFIRDNKGFNVTYTAHPSEFMKYRNEAIEMIQSIRFSESKNEK